MNPPRCDELDYIQFLIAAQRVFTCTEAARCQPESPAAPGHDSFTRLLRRRPPDTAALWQEVQGLVRRDEGVLVLDDTTSSHPQDSVAPFATALDKPHARKMELVTRHWSGRHQRVVLGINLLTVIWTDGKALIPCDFRVYDKPVGGLTKDEHFRALLQEAHGRDFRPRYVLFDSWYASLENLKAVRACGWAWLTRLKGNRHVDPDRSGNVELEQVTIPPEGRVVHLKGYGLIKVFQTVAKDGDVEYWATSDLELGEKARKELKKQAFGIESYHRGIKQCCGIELAHVRKAEAQRSHFLLALQAFVRLEVYRLQTGVSWYEAKTSIARTAIRQYLAQPTYQLSTA